MILHLVVENPSATIASIFVPFNALEVSTRLNSPHFQNMSRDCVIDEI
jgi:hypothetical protein